MLGSIIALIKNLVAREALNIKTNTLRLNTQWKKSLSGFNKVCVGKIIVIGWSSGQCNFTVL